MAVALDQIVPWGRTRREYESMFRLAGAELSSGILDCGGGPASFAAEMAAAGHRVVSADPIYTRPGPEIRGRFDETARRILSQVRASPNDWVWSFHRDPDDLRANRRAALERFLADYEPGARQGRYVTAALPNLPFANGAFGLALCSHLLFLYSDLLSAEFHLRSLIELARVAREIRVFPLLNLDLKPSRHVEGVRSSLAAQGLASEIVRVDYELQRGGNKMLRLFKG